MTMLAFALAVTIALLVVVLYKVETLIDMVRELQKEVRRRR